MNWIHAIENWRRLSAEERRHRHMEALPRHVANSVALEGKLVDEEWIRQWLARSVQAAVKSTGQIES